MEARLVELLKEYRLVAKGDFGRPGEKAGLTKADKQAAWTQVAEKINRLVNNLTNVNKTYWYVVWWQRLMSQGLMKAVLSLPRFLFFLYGPHSVTSYQLNPDLIN